MLEPAGNQLLVRSADEIRKKRYARAGPGRRRLTDLIAGPKGQARAGEVPGQPACLRQAGIYLVETDEHRLGAGFNPAMEVGCRIESEAQRHQRPGNYVAILWLSEAQGDVGLAPFQAHGPEVGRHVDIEPGILRAQLCERIDKKGLRETRRSVHADKSHWSIVRASAAEARGSSLHFAGGSEHARARRGEHIAVGAPFD